MKKLLLLILSLVSSQGFAYWTDSWSNPYADKYGVEQNNYYKTQFEDKTFNKPADYQYQYNDTNLDKYGYQPKEYTPNEYEYNPSATPSSSYYQNYQKNTSDYLNRRVGPSYQNNNYPIYNNRYQNSTFGQSFRP
ncbi:hypothetical protein Noda2021_04280 [Candidatus Dependentiae bacterium Noda2021]|nr:hypothetical protein Noda2021_04280 [Candidatus Dependentiae bacterium Noda2021]